MRVAATYLCLTQELRKEFSGKVFQGVGSFFRAGRIAFRSIVSRVYVKFHAAELLFLRDRCGALFRRVAHHECEPHG